MSTLAYLRRASTSGILLRYDLESGDTVPASATLRVMQVSSGSITATQSMTAGTAAWVAGVPTGRYIAWVDEYDATPAIIRHTDPILFQHVADETDADQLSFYWAGDERDWIERELSTTMKRRSVYTNEGCHRLRWKLESLGQNVRTTVRSVNFHLRQRGRSESVEE